MSGASMAHRLEGKIAFITGAAGAQGRAAARAFARHGARVALADVDEAGVHALQREVEAQGGEAVALTCDVTSEDSVKRAVEAALSRFGSLNVLYNNAGINNGGPTEAERDCDVIRLPLHIWQRMIDVNLTGVFLCSKHAIPALIAAGGGSVINISSTAGILGSSISGHTYSATKGGVNSLTRSMAAAYAKHLVRVNAICPGSLEPVMKFGIPRTPQRQKMLEANYPIGRLGTEDDVVHLAVYLASDESAWTTGAVIPVDGGFTSTS
ncbi:MAG: SDR family oxidoreductase [Rubrivivax sp.]|nr:SDR family oxidoreductase [Rubrivivax sp.]